MPPNAIDDDAVRKVLREHLQGVTDYPGDALVAWENRVFDPPDDGDTLWLRETLLPADDTKVATGLIQGIGIYQVDVMYPKGRGSEVPEAMAKNIKLHFQPATHIGTTTRLEIDRSARLRAGVDDVWYMIPVRISFRTYAFTISP